MEIVNVNSNPLIFDDWVDLAKNNPIEFERLKNKVLEQAITLASEKMQTRLRAQQSNLNHMIERCTNPHQVNVILAQELKLQVIKMKKALDGESIGTHSAEIIPFPSRN